MNKLDEFFKNIRRAETPFYKGLYKTAKAIRAVELPAVPVVHDALFKLHQTKIIATREAKQFLYYQPLFKSQLNSCGKRLKLESSGQGMPVILGQVEINVGNDVTIYDRITISGLTIGDNPTINIGDFTDISRSISLLVGNEITIGKECLIASNLVTDNPGHRLEYDQRRFEKIHKDQIGRVEIGDYVWAGVQSMIIGNVKVGAGAIIGANAVVTKDVPAFCVVAGSPAKVVKKLPFPDKMREILGEAEYQKYCDAKLK